MTDEEIKQAAQMFEDHMKKCSICKKGFDVCPTGGKLLHFFYQALTDAIAPIDPTKKKPPHSVN